MNTQLINELKQRSTLTQNELQDAVPLVFDSCSALLLEWITGLGKGRAIMKACEKFEKVLFVVEKLKHIDNFKEDCEKHGFKYEQYTFTHYNSLKKYENQEFNCVVLNEADVISDNAKLCLSKIHFDKLLLAAAMFKLAKKVSFWKVVSNFDTWKIDLRQAIAWGILPMPEIHVYFIRPGNNIIEFDVIKSKFYETKYCYTFDEFVRLNSQKVNMKISCVENEALRIITNLVQYTKEVAQDKGWGTKRKPSYAALQCFKYGNMRKNILSKIKLDKMKEISQRIGGRQVIFVNAIEDCFIPNYVYSKNGDDANNEVLRKFNEGEEDIIMALKMFNRDMNLVNCSKAIIGVLSGDMVEIMQRIGRVLRHEHPEVHIPIVQGEKDESLLKKQLKSYISHYE